MSEPFLGQILLVPYDFAVSGWAFCQGQLLSISQNTALFALLGTQFGGDGVQTFALPDLRGRVVVGQGTGPGLSPYQVGEIGGSVTVTLLSNQIPQHNHGFPASAEPANSSTPSSATLLGSGSRGSLPRYASPALQSGAPATMSGIMIGNAGGSQPHNNLMPYLTLNYIIALAGIFPARS